MDVRIVELVTKNVVCMKMVTTIAEDKTVQLWRTFMPRRKEIIGAFSGNYSVQVYSGGLLSKPFTPKTEFTKWAAVEVPEGSVIPEGMMKEEIPGGMYAIFIHKGPASGFPETAREIFEVWLPGSEYELDDRPHFEFMGENYLGPMHPKAEEEVFIPIKKKEEVNQNKNG